MNELRRHQLIQNIMAPHTENVANGAISLWEKMAGQLVSIIGEVAFDALYARSIVRAQSTFSWLENGLDRQFSPLRISLDGQAAEQAGEANSLLLVIFTDILASYIGEDLTGNILHSAWSDEESDAAKESQNE